MKRQELERSVVAGSKAGAGMLLWYRLPGFKSISSVSGKLGKAPRRACDWPPGRDLSANHSAGQVIVVLAWLAGGGLPEVPGRAATLLAGRDEDGYRTKNEELRLWTAALCGETRQKEAAMALRACASAPQVPRLACRGWRASAGGGSGRGGPSRRLLPLPGTVSRPLILATFSSRCRGRLRRRP